MNETLEDLIKQTLRNYPNESYSKTANRILEESDLFSHRTLRRKIARVAKQVKQEDSLHGVPTTFNYKGEQPITSLEEAIEFFDIDVDAYEVTGYSCNAWDVSTKTGKKTNYQVKLSLKPRGDEIDYQSIKQELDKAISTINIKKTPGIKTGVICLADLHIGADIRNLQRTPDFNYKVVINYLRDIAEEVNRRGYKKTELIFLGDFIESFTGLNHINSWKSMGKGLYGHHVVILAFEIMRDFIESINNLSSIYIVSGNHDRSTSDAKHDNEGDIAGLLSYMLRNAFVNDKIKVEFSPLVLGDNIDGIYYIMTHNHHGLSKRDLGKIIWEYGKQGMYNVLLGGHWHSRRGKKVFHTLEETYVDQANYRAIDVAPLFTGNFYSESNGWTSSAGFTLIENNGIGKPNVFDYSL